MKNILKEKSFKSETRNILKTALEKQYNSVDSSELTNENIRLLAKNNTFTIVTGHQLNIFTGPLYFLYKIIYEKFHIHILVM